MALEKIRSSNFKAIGQYFTPDYIADFMIHNLVKKYCEIHDLKEYSIPDLNLKVLDPATGEGIFLKYLISLGFKDLTAYEIDPTLKVLLLKKYPEVKFQFKDFLASMPKPTFDIIIGNPPYLGQNYNSELFQDLCSNYAYCSDKFVGNMDLFYYFIHLGIDMLKPGGLLSYITTNYWIFKSQKTGIKKLKPHLVKDSIFVQYVDLSGIKVFKDALGQHNCIFILQKKDGMNRDNSQRDIEIIQLNTAHGLTSNKDLFDGILNEKFSDSYLKYPSAIRSLDLDESRSWNILYPREVEMFVDKINKFCMKEGTVNYLNDLFLIRNGLILIKDDFFILKEGKDLKIQDGDYLIRVGGEFKKLSLQELHRLKKVYKSRAIRQYGYEKEDFEGYLIYFNKSEFEGLSNEDRIHQIKSKYPSLCKYLESHKELLQEILRNARENVEDIYFPRRGSYIQASKASFKTYIDLEPYYEHFPKIFFKYISQDNLFGYTQDNYFATSDTYFLWPRDFDKEINYPFFIAYLNSIIVSFLFKAKNLVIKRSKTKIEQEIPIPYMNSFCHRNDLLRIEFISFLTNFLTKDKNQNASKRKLLYKLIDGKYQAILKNEDLKNLVRSIKDGDHKHAKYLIDLLFCELFQLDIKQIDYLIKKYYFH